MIERVILVFFYRSEDWNVIKLIARKTTPIAATTKYTIVAIKYLLLMSGIPACYR